MHRTFFCLGLLFLSVLLASPVAVAVARFDATDVTLQDAKGHALATVPQTEKVAFLIKVQNTGNATGNKTITILLHFATSDLGFKSDEQLNATVNLKPGASTTVKYEWKPSDKRTPGNYTLNITVKDYSASPLQFNFVVEKSTVATGDFGTLVLRYYWVFAPLLVAIVVFFVVLGARKG